MTFQAICNFCGGTYGHPGPCPRCVPPGGPHIQRALDLAVEAHRNEWRKGGVRLPYIVHFCDIMRIAQRIGINTASSDLYQTILLHDAVESGLPIERIRQLDTMVAEYVEELTFIPSGDDPRITAQEKDQYLASFHGKSLVALAVKLLDRIANCYDFLETNPRYAPKYFGKAQKLFQAFRDRKAEFEKRWGVEVADRFEEQLNRLQNEIQSSRGMES